MVTVIVGPVGLILQNSISIVDNNSIMYSQADDVTASNHIKVSILVGVVQLSTDHKML